MNPLDNIRIVLVGTLYSGNVGSVCRAMANMGIHDLVLAANRLCDDWREAERLAVHATDILSAAKRFDTVAEAIADCHAIIGSTARGGLYRQTVKTPAELAPSILELALQGKVAILFGREDQGLNNEEIGLCTHLCRIPVDPNYQSLNLSQAVLLICYELYGATGTYEQPVIEKAPLSTAAERAVLMGKWRKAMLDIGFMDEEKAAHMMQGFQRIFSRGIRTSDDARIMIGVSRQAQWSATHPTITQDAPPSSKEIQCDQ